MVELLLEKRLALRLTQVACSVHNSAEVYPNTEYFRSSIAVSQLVAPASSWDFSRIVKLASIAIFANAFSTFQHAVNLATSLGHIWRCGLWMQRS